MAKIAFLFPGQGSQSVGMGKDFFEEGSHKALFEEANETLGFDITSLLFNGPEEKLMLTENGQPAILLVSAVALKYLEAKGIRPDWVAGHSLGEYSALLAGGALTFKEALYAVRQRGLFMQEAAPVGSGGMAAIIGLEGEVINKLCLQVREKGFVAPANFNSPEQTVLAGERGPLEEVVEMAKTEGAKKALMLSVSAPFHSPLIEAAVPRLEAELHKISLRAPSIPLVTNVDAAPLKGVEDIVPNLSRQVCSPVRWSESMQFLLTQGVDTFIEVGPNRVLSGLMKRIHRKARCLNVQDMASLNKTLEALI